MMSGLTKLAHDKHEKVCFFHDRATGLQVIIAVHDTTLGPSLGGCRFRNYPSLDDALFDVLNLAEGMTYKSSLAGLNLGGGKSVIVGDNSMVQGREELFLKFAECVESLGGAYITAEDMGTSVEDMTAILQKTKFVAGLGKESGGAGDPSPYTAKGVFEGGRACLERVFGSASYEGRTVAIQGVGHVGYYLGKMLKEEGATLKISDTNEDRLQAAAKEFEAEVVDVDRIHSVSCDVFAPCAIGRTVNETTVGQLNCKIISGAANNIIGGETTKTKLMDRGITYAPDFAINAGGAIAVAQAVHPDGFSHERAIEKVFAIRNTVAQILDRSSETGRPPGDIAVELAMERVAAARAERRK